MSRWFLATVALLSGTLAAGGQTTSAPEDEVMSALILGFVRYSEWPAANGEESAPLVVCVAGRPPLVRALNHAVSGKVVQGHPLQAREVRTPPETGQCKVLFVSSGSKRSVEAMLTAVRGIPVLTIGDSDEILQAGGMVQFFEEDGKMRFAVNLEALNRSKVNVSARLLRLGQVVRGRER